MGKKVIVSILVAMVSIGLAWPETAWAQKGPIKIGVITPMTGGAAQIGKDMTSGISMWLEENGGMIAGRKVEVIVEDSQGQPNVALTKLAKLVESDRVHVLVGEVFAHIGYAMAPKVDEYRIPMLYPVIAADDSGPVTPADAAPLPSAEGVEDFRDAVTAFERRILEDALARNRYNQKATATALNLSYDQLRHALKRHELLNAQPG